MTHRYQLQKHSVTLGGHRTSITLESSFWEAFKQIARTQGYSINQLAMQLDTKRVALDPMPNLSSMIRVFVLEKHLNETKTPTP